MLNNFTRCAIFSNPVTYNVNSYVSVLGPFRFVDSYGAQNLLDRMNKFREVYGDHFDPAPLLMDYAKDSNKKFYHK